MLGSFGDSLRGTLQKVKDAVFVDDSLIKEVVKDVQRSLMKADVDIQLVLELAKNIKKQAKEDTPPGLSKQEHIVKIIYDELVEFVGDGAHDLLPRISASHEPYTVMLVGLYGSGKTTTAGKLAKKYKQHGKKVALIGTDTWRPAAADQLKQLGEDVGVPTHAQNAEDPVNAYREARENVEDADLVIVDTAGRDALNEELKDELVGLKSAVEPDETILVLSGDIGQGAKDTAATFKEHAGVNGVIVTKLDGTAKGGGALTACKTVDAPIFFIGTGEAMDALETFGSERFIGRLLGMGDIEGLLERAQQAFDEEEAQDLTKKMMEGDFDLRDLYKQLESMQSMGPLKKVLDMIPGMSNMGIKDKDLEEQQENMKQWRYLMDSMTDYELENPDKIKKSRRERISTGAGVSEAKLRALLSQYKKTKKMMKKMGGRNQRQMKKMMKQMGGGGNLPF